MSDYPSQSPWGPHGPQTSGPPTTMPNPTAPWSEPSSSNQPAYGGGGNGILVELLFRPPKKFWLAIPFAWFFGPFGLLYAIGNSRPQLIALAAFVAGAILLHLSPLPSPPPRFHPILLICAVWSIFAARAWNKRHNF
jgi:hypothetical protein